MGENQYTPLARSAAWPKMPICLGNHGNALLWLSKPTMGIESEGSADPFRASPLIVARHSQGPP